MEFTCAHCERPIRCSAILVDGEFLHSTCEASFTEAKAEKLDACSENSVVQES